jgi:hypothetical protein
MAVFGKCRHDAEDTEEEGEEGSVHCLFVFNGDTKLG